MRLPELSRDLLLAALRGYLEIAWPSSVEERFPALGEGRRGEELLEVFTDETNQDRGRVTRRYVLRLGNRRYPHMKFVLEEFLIPDEFIFSVDTHDEPDLKPDYPDYEAWQELKGYNRELKGRIERAWHARGVPTIFKLRDIVDRAEPRPGDRDSGGKILVVDDQREIADAVATILLTAGYDVLLAHDGEEAVGTALRERPDLILMDFDMPRLDGVEAAKRIRRSLEKKECRILLATAALVNLADVEEADGFLLKPYARDILISFIQALLKQGG